MKSYLPSPSKKYLSHFKDASLPPQVIIGSAIPFEQEKITAFERSQLWDVPNSDQLLSTCTHQLFISDMMSYMDHKDRCELLMDWLEAAMELFPDCTTVWIPSAGKLLTAQAVREQNIPRQDRFIHVGVNVRFFNIQDTDDMVIDTYGMYAMDLPDVQYHFHSLDPNAVVNHAYNVASYIFSSEREIESGETIDGLSDNGISREVQWRCQYEEALIQPARTVLDICPGEYAAGNRE